MTLALQNFLDKQSVVNADWLNEVDQKRATLIQPLPPSGAILGVPRCIVKVQQTIRNNTNTPAADAELQFPGCEPGTYVMRVMLLPQALDVGGSGFKVNMGNLATPAVGNLSGQGVVNTAVYGPVFLAGTASVLTAATIATGATSDYLALEQVILNTVAGVISVNWAPNTNSANRTSLNVNSWATLTRLA